MLFYVFIMACKKYKFRYMVTSYIKPSIILYPSNTFDKIEINNLSYFRLFLTAIKKMKKYRKGCVC